MSQPGYCSRFEGKVQQHELKQVGERRKLVHEVDPPPNTPRPLEWDLVGLAFSGGGIRSATFNLGILQALASLKLLTRIDYLSTVSGGGFIASWLAAWIRRETTKDKKPGILNVQEQLNPSRVTQAGADRRYPPDKIHPAEPEPIRHLRAYSRYLSPRLGVLSLDSWALVALYLRNLLANGLLFLFSVVTLILLARLAVTWVMLPRGDDFSSWLILGVVAVLLFFGQLAYRWFLADVRDASRLWTRREPQPDPARPTTPTEHTWKIFLAVVLPCIVAGLFSMWLFGPSPRDGHSRLPMVFWLGSTDDDPLGRAWAALTRVGPSDELLRRVGRSGVTEDDFRSFLDWVGLSDDRERLNGRGEYAAYGVFFAAFGAFMFVVGGVMRYGNWVMPLATAGLGRLRRLSIRGSLLQRWLGVLVFLIGAALVVALTAALLPFSGVLRLIVRVVLILICGLLVLIGLSSSPGVRRWQHEPFTRQAWRKGWRRTRNRIRVFGRLLREWWEGVASAFWPWIKDTARTMFGSVVYGLAFGLMFCALIKNVAEPTDGVLPSYVLATSFGVPLFLAALVIGGYLDSIISGTSLGEYEREWRGRIGAMVLRTAAAWAVVFAVVFYLPWVIETQSAAIVAGLVWAAGAVGTYLFRRPPGAAGGQPPRSLWDRVGAWVLLLAPPVVLAGFVGLASALVDRLPQVSSGTRYFLTRAEEAEFAPVLGWLILVAAVGFGYAFFVRPNLFSLHTLFGNRLVRCYLGASRRKVDWDTRAPTEAPPGVGAWGAATGWDAPTQAPPGVGAWGAPTGVNDRTRQGNPFTGFGPRDDFSLLWLSADPSRYPQAEPTTQEPWKRTGKPYSGPYPIFNTTLNLVGGEELALQDRKGESFVLTPDYCGSGSTGYARLGVPDGGRGPIDYRALTVGRAVAISGAAVDPNMRNYQTAAFTLLLTVLNLRTGWWLQNPWPGPGPVPAKRVWTGEGPWSARFLISEALGATRADRAHVHLSDGGHFENTGAYELIRRRCRYIIIVDAAEDPSDASENLANLIRLVRIDFGIEIEINTTPLRKDANGLSRWHCAVGAIRYGEVDAGGVTGTLVFIRSSLTGDEPADLRNYAATHPPFPHHSTADQFFDEDQFESYRALGQHVGIAVFTGAKATMREEETNTDTKYRGFNRAFFGAVRRQWAPLPDSQTDAYLRSCRDYLETVAHMRDRPQLRELSRSLYAEAPGADLTALHEVDYLLQVMELSWLENELDRYHAHPFNRGWMNVLRRWTASGVFQQYWPILRGQFSRGFVQFCEVGLNLSELPVQWCRITDPAREPWATILRQLDEEFHNEWAVVLRTMPGLAPADAARYPSWAVRQSHWPAARVTMAFAAEHRLWNLWPTELPAPLAWVLTNGQPGQSVGRLDDWPANALPLGLVVAFDSPASTDRYREWELLAWVRGPYRILGLGRNSLPKLLDVIDDELTRRGVERLFVRYPRLGSSQGDRLQRIMWTWFFNDHDFVANGRARRDEVRLVRRVSLPNPVLPAQTGIDPPVDPKVAATPTAPTTGPTPA